MKSRILSNEECAHIAIVNPTPVVQDLLSTILYWRSRAEGKLVHDCHPYDRGVDCPACQEEVRERYARASQAVPHS